MKQRLTMNLQLFAEEEAVETGVEDVSAAETPETETPEVVTESETGANETEVAAEPEKQNNFEKAFAKRLAAERSKWDTEVNEKYKDYDTHKELSQYFQEINGADAMTLKEQIELAKLQERAEEQNVPPEVLKRIDELEAKAARGDELEQLQIKEQNDRIYWSSAEKFVEGKDIDKDELNKFMVENEIYVDLSNPEQMNKKFEMAYKAMTAEKLQEQLKTAKETAVKEYLQSKSAPRVEGSGSPGVVTEDTSKMTFKQIEQRAAARLAALNQAT